MADTKKRISESEKRVDTKLGEFVNKQYWCAPAPAWSSMTVCQAHCREGHAAHPIMFVPFSARLEDTCGLW